MEMCLPRVSLVSSNDQFARSSNVLRASFPMLGGARTTQYQPAASILGPRCRLHVGRPSHLRAITARSAPLGESEKLASFQVHEVQQALEVALDKLDALSNNYVEARPFASSSQQVSGTWSTDSSVAQRESQLWDRYLALFDREMARWTDERRRWDEERRQWSAREAALLETIRQLNAKESRAESAAGLSSSPPLVPQTGMEHRGQPSRHDPAHTPTPSDMRGHTADQNPMREVQPDQQQQQVARAPMQQPSLQQQLAAAFAAVDTTDVLHEEVDFLRLRPTSEQAVQVSPEPKASASSAAGTTLAASQSAGVVPTRSAAASAVPSGRQLPPVLMVGADDIFWVSQLHEALLERGYFPGDEETEEWLFGGQTESALLTFQACEGLPETGIADLPTWKALLGEELRPLRLVTNPIPAEEESHGGEADDGGSSATVSEAPWADLFETGTQPQLSGNGAQRGEFSQLQVLGMVYARCSHNVLARPSAGSDGNARADWPILREGDGGADVHHLQVALGRCGYHCGDDEMQWWQFGMGTLAAMQMFQAAKGLPESGVSDQDSWQALLGPDAQPWDIASLQSGTGTDDDMLASHEGAVWLVGEQRWSRPTRPGS